MGVRDCGVAIGMMSLFACTVYGEYQGDDDVSSSSSGGSTSSASSSSGDGSTSSSSGSSTSGSSSGEASSSGGSSSGDALNDFERDILQRLNAARQDPTLSPVPSPALPMLTWDYEAAATARAYVEGCGGEGPAGFIYGGSSPPLTAQDIVEILSVGRSYFQYPNACQSGQDGACELWRLVINRQATQAGCALKSCGGGEDVWSCRIGDGSRPPAPPY